MYGQERPANETVKDGVVYTYLDKFPSPGYDLNQYLIDRLNYPESARKTKTAGRVVVKFAVNADGSISDCKVTTSLSKDCDEEALRLIRAMPAWHPGIYDGKPVKASFVQTVIFKMD